VNIESLKTNSWDERRNLLIPGDKTSTLDLCVRHFISVCQTSIEKRGSFMVALAGGSTPKTIYEHLSVDPCKAQIQWGKVHLFWGDERSVPPTDPQNNYKMAMDAGLGEVEIPSEQIHRMVAEEAIEENALKYDKLLHSTLKDHPFDLVILGMGEDGHTASLFPQTDGLKIKNRLAIANYVPQKNTWRMTLTYEAINNAENIAIYVIGANKRVILAEVLKSKDQFERYPIQKIGTKDNKALWIIDDAAASDLLP